MKFKILPYNRDEEKEVYFRLIQDGDGIILFATDSLGEKISGGNILRIREDGVIGLFSGVSPKTGLKTENGGFAIVARKPMLV